jgi:hypothetical protein
LREPIAVVARSHLFKTLTHRFMKAILKLTCIGGLLSGFMLAIAPKTQAQDYNIYGIDYVSPAVTRVQNETKIRSIIDRNGGSTTPAKTPKATRSSSGRSNLAYSTTPALKQKVVQGYISNLETTNPAASQAIAAAFGSGKSDYGQVYRGLFKGKGLRENDVADVMSAYLILGYSIVNNVDTNAVTIPMVRGVRSQIAPLLASNPGLSTPGLPAQLGEQMKLQLAIAQRGRQEAIEQNSLPSYQQIVATLFKNQYGMDLTQLRLTDRGFVKK